MTKGIVFDIKKFALHDGPGIRTTVFLKGCPMRCDWCHNPESQSFKMELMVRRSRCIRCGSCTVLCEFEALKLAKDGPRVNLLKCKVCGECADVCNAEALQLIGRETTAEEVMNEVLKDEPFYKESGGGVTFSGGEPLGQPKFLLELLKASKRKGLHTTVDTCGCAKWKDIERIASYTDLFLYDIKLMDPKRHHKHTGMSNKLVVENLKKLSGSGASIVVRLAIIPGINDDEKNIEETGKFVAKLKGVERIDILPYHAMAADKYANLQRNEKMAAVKPPTKQRMQGIAKMLAKHGLEVSIGG